MVSLTGKQVLLKDLSNIRAQFTAESTCSRNDLEVCVKKLTDKHGKNKYQLIIMYIPI